MSYIMLRTTTLAAVLAARACSEEAEASTPPQAATPPVVSVPVAAAPPVTGSQRGPRHGGTIVSAGPSRVEVVTHQSGQVYVYPTEGIAEPTSAEVKVNVHVEGGTRPVDLVWVPRQRRYEGRVVDARILPGTSTVTVVLGGVPYVGFTHVLVLAPAIVIEVEHDHRHHGKHKHKHHGHGHGRGHGRGHGGWH